MRKKHLLLLLLFFSTAIKRELALESSLRKFAIVGMCNNAGDFGRSTQPLAAAECQRGVEGGANFL